MVGFVESTKESDVKSKVKTILSKIYVKIINKK